jgi:LmbE family N-acetylglucosaminyl deacetylase
VLGVFAHPDDETFFAGATLAAYAATGCRVRLVTLTAGEAGVIGTAAARAAAGEPDEAAIKQAADRGVARYTRACETLGVKDVRVLGGGRWRDLGPVPAPGSLAGRLPNPSATRAPIGPVVTSVKQALTEFSPDVVLTVAGDGVTGHPDHIACHQAVVEAVRLVATEERKVSLTLGGCVRTKDVHAAWERLAPLGPTRPPGDGGIRGCPAETDLLTVRVDEFAMQAKRNALDTYTPGLGTQPLDALATGRTPVGDGVLLRAIAEVAGMDREFFRALRPG